MGYIKVVRTAGLDYIDIERKFDFLGCVENTTDAINR